MFAGSAGGLRTVVYRCRRQEESAGSVREGKFFESTGALFGDFPGKAPDCPTGFSGIRVCIKIVVEADKNLFAERAKFVGIAQTLTPNSSDPKLETCITNFPYWAWTPRAPAAAMTRRLAAVLSRCHRANG